MTVLKREVAPGVRTWTTDSGIGVVRVHYTADPDRCDEEWLEQQLVGYEGGMEGRRWRQEMEIDFSSYAGQPVYPNFKDASIIETNFNSHLPLWRGWDFGFRHPAVVWMQHWTDTDTLVVLREFYPTIDPLRVPGLTTTSLGQQVQEITSSFFPTAERVYDFCDPAGVQTKETSEFSSVEHLAHLGIDCEWNVVGRKNRINNARRFVENGIGRFRISPTGCPLLIEAFQGAYRYPEEDDKSAPRDPEMPDLSGVVQKDPYIHVMDAFEYVVACNLIQDFPEAGDEVNSRPSWMPVAELDPFAVAMRFHTELKEKLEDDANINEFLELDW